LERFVLQTESKDLLFEMLRDHFTPDRVHPSAFSVAMCTSLE
jgi:hypothetical protein